MTERLADLVGSINKLGDAFDEFKTRNDETLGGLQNRLEELEAKSNRPPKTSVTPSAIQANHKMYHTAGGGKVYEFPSNVKVADVLRPETQSVGVV